MNSNGAPFSFPSLPIVTPDPPPRTQTEKYGLLLYIGFGGLVVLLYLIGWFGYRVWAMLPVWRNVYVLNDAKAPEGSRIQAAFDFSRDPRVEPRQLWDLCLHRDLPDLARYILAEGISADLVAADPQGYASAVARSEGWPDWLRLVLTRPMAYAATRGHALSRERLAELCRLGDPQLRLWTLYALALQPHPDPDTKAEIEKLASEPGPDRDLARIFEKALAAEGPGRLDALDEATYWTRSHHPGASRLWNGWNLNDSRIERAASP
jgi:hypothetical protein